LSQFVAGELDQLGYLTEHNCVAEELVPIDCWTAQGTNLNSSAENIFDKWQFFYLWNRSHILCKLKVFLALLGITYNTVQKSDRPYSCRCQILCSSYGSLLSLLESCALHYHWRLNGLVTSRKHVGTLLYLDIILLHLNAYKLLLQYGEASLVLYEYSMGQLDIHDVPSSMGSGDLRDPKPPLCTCVINGQGVLPCHDKIEMELNWLASNAWEEWKSFIGFEEPAASISGNETVIIQGKHTIAVDSKPLILAMMFQSTHKKLWAVTDHGVRRLHLPATSSASQGMLHRCLLNLGDCFYSSRFDQVDGFSGIDYFLGAFWSSFARVFQRQLLEGKQRQKEGEMSQPLIDPG
jgi:hypothetical protein